MSVLESAEMNSKSPGGKSNNSYRGLIFCKEECNKWDYPMVRPFLLNFLLYVNYMADKTDQLYEYVSMKS